MRERNPVEIRVETIINNEASIIWDYATLPENWKKEMPNDHFALVYENGSPETGRKLHVEESIGGLRTDIDALFLYVRRPKVLVWTGNASIRLLGGVIKPKFHVSQTVTFNENESGVIVRNTLYIYFPESYLGRIMQWIFLEVIHGERIYRTHLERETLYVKEKLDLN